MKHIIIDAFHEQTALVSRKVWMSAALLGLLLFFATTLQGFAQAPASNTANAPREVKGVILDESGEPLPAANIFLKEKPGVGTVSDIDGNFTFPRKLSEGEVIVFSFIGFDTQEYVVTAEMPARLEVNMIMYNEMAGELAGGEVYSSRSGVENLWYRMKQWFD